MVNSRLEWWCLRLDEGVMGKEDAGEARGGGWASCGEQLCPPPESNGELLVSLRGLSRSLW